MYFATLPVKYTADNRSRCDGSKGSSGTRNTVRKALASIPPLEIVNLYRDPDGVLF